MLLLVLVAGCGKEPAVQPELPANSTTAAETTPADVAGTDEIPSYALDDLSELGSYLPPLDDDRLRIAPPAGWHVESRSRDHLARFVRDKTRRVPLPMITVLVEDADFEDLRDLNADNHLEFADFVEDGLEESTREALAEPVGPLILGDVRIVRYVVKKTFERNKKKFAADREVIKTLKRGRVYTVLLDVYPNQLVEFRADAYAVVGGMQLHTPTEAGDASVGTNPAGDDKSDDPVPDEG